MERTLGVNIFLAPGKGLLGRLKRRAASLNPSDYSTIEGLNQTVPGQVEAYFLALRYVQEGDRVLDVGFGLGYGLNLLSIKAREVVGVDVDVKVYQHALDFLVGRNPKLTGVTLYDGYHLPFDDNSFDIVTSVDAIEHVEDYDRLLKDMFRVARRGVYLSTPNRRVEYTNADGMPKNYWHLREWSFEEFEPIVKKYGIPEWRFIGGPWEGPFTVTDRVQSDTLTLAPFLAKPQEMTLGAR